MVIPSLKVFTFHINIVHIPMEQSKNASHYCHFLFFLGDRNFFSWKNLKFARSERFSGFFTCQNLENNGNFLL
jgi:hypothetical protein